MIKETLFKQTWWVSLAVILAGLQILFVGYVMTTYSEASGMERLVIIPAWGGSALLAILGTQQRLGHRRTGDALIALGVVPAVVIGIIAWWFPPLWFITAAGLLVIWLSIRDAVNPVRVPVPDGW